MSDDTETEDSETNTLSSIEGVFSDSDEKPSFSDGPTTPDEGHINPGEEETSVLDKIAELEHDAPDAFEHKEGGGCAYIPVGDSMLPYLEKRRQKGKGFTIGDKRLYWWVDDSLMTEHPWILLNPTTLANRNYHYDANICREFIDANRGDTFVLADSGGFQIVRHREHEIAENVQDHNWESDLHPQRVLEWQVANADAGTILDIPVYQAFDDFAEQEYDGFGSSEYTEWYDDILIPHTEQTVSNAKVAVNRWQEIDYDGFDLMGVIHGMPRQDGNGHVMEAYRRWFNPINDVYDFEGWSLANRYSDHPGLVATLLAFASKNIRDAEFVHVLGHGNVWARILSKLYAQMTDTFVTMDGTGFKIGSMFSTMYIPTTYMKSIRLTDRDEENEETRYEKLEAERMPCGCGVCRQVEREIGGKELFEKPGTERMVIMDMHNLNHLLRRFYLLDSFVEARGESLLDEAELNPNADTSAGVEVNANSEFWRILKNWLSQSRVAEVYYCMDIVSRACNGEDLESIFDDYWIKTPFFQKSPGGYKEDTRPSVFTNTSASVFEW